MIERAAAADIARARQLFSNQSGAPQLGRRAARGDDSGQSSKSERHKTRQAAVGCDSDADSEGNCDASEALIWLPGARVSRSRLSAANWGAQRESCAEQPSGGGERNSLGFCRRAAARVLLADNCRRRPDSRGCRAVKREAGRWLSARPSRPNRALMGAGCENNGRPTDHP